MDATAALSERRPDASAPRAASGSFLLPPWASLSDAALLAHFRAARPVHYLPVVDAEETRPAKIEALMHGRFEFNGQAHDLPDPIDWLANPSADVEWHILLHKFYYAVGLGQRFEHSGDARYAQRWAALIDGWMRQVSAGFIAADVTGRRVQNWIYSYRFFVTHAAHAWPLDAAWHRRLLASLHEQVEFLCANLTPKRNHRTLELLAILLAGVAFPEMRRAAHWRELAVRETLANLDSDLLSDGVHCELSTDYHHLALRNWLNARQLLADNGHAVPAAMDRALERALEFSLHVHKPDGDVPSLSDGDVRSYLELLERGATLFGREDFRYVASGGERGTPPPVRAAHFAAGGYTVLRSGWDRGAQYLVFDSGPLGEGNHGHFDALSFELAAGARSLIVDPGRYTYSEAVDPADPAAPAAGGVNWRVHFRGTAAHNTVCVDGLQQTRYAPKAVKDPGSRHATGSVRHKIAGPAAEAKLVARYHGPGLDLLHGRVVSAEYDAVHERCILFVGRRWWIVSDGLRAGREHDYVLNFQLGPAAEGRCRIDTAGGLRLHSPGLVIAQPARDGTSHTLAAGWVSERYGHKERAPALRSHCRARDAGFDTLLLPEVAGDGATLQSLTETAFEAADGSRAAALRVTFAGLAGPAGAAGLADPAIDPGPGPRHGDGRETWTWFNARSAAAQRWHGGPVTFEGRWLLWREGADGEDGAEGTEGAPIVALSHAGASLEIAGRAVALQTLEAA